MKFLSDLQHRFGCTVTEIRVMVFLTLTLLTGVGIKWLRSAEGASGAIRPVFDYSQSDSEFVARSRTVFADTTGDDGRLSRRTHPQKPRVPPGGIDINSASREQLTILPGIGDAYAERIILHRDANGPFRSVDALEEVRGIGPKTLAKIRPFVRVGPH